ncbi:MAG: DUF1919 domain-containing protein [Bacilli bacterium]|nr:DUF1919 domain-containing protein [Bacilli bacterium]
MNKFENLVETIKIKVRRYYIKKTAKIRSKKITNDNFTIISNNCWGGFIYQSYALKYNTPTVGMFFMADDYIKFISNLKHYLDIDDIIFMNPKESKWYKYLSANSSFGTYPIVKLDDIEIFCLHYHSEQEFIEKWNERKKRINYNNILFKFSEMNQCKKQNILDFKKLKYKNKICFISKKYKDLADENTFIVSKDLKNQIKSTDEPIGNSHIVNVNNIINNLK